MSSNSTVTAASDIPGTVTPMEFPKETPPEMMPILTLLHSHQQRDYYQGYFMLLNDLNSGMYLLHVINFRFLSFSLLIYFFYKMGNHLQTGAG